MRIFATGAIQWVMGKGWPDDVPIEAKMVSKAIERAQNTVEQRNAEIRKNVLKYDEVMNEQRKVIYARRDQVLDGADLRERAMEYLAEAVDTTIAPTACRLREEWDVDGSDHRGEGLLAHRPHRRSSWSRPTSTDEMYDLLMAEATTHYESARGAQRGAMRDLERQVMLRIIDQPGVSTSRRWTTSRRASGCGPWARRTR
jgi:preprotein translocase subunit SecA